MKDEAKKSQLMRLIAMLNDRILDEGGDEERDEDRDLKKELGEQMRGKEDEMREMTIDEHPEEDLREDERRHDEEYDKDDEDIDEDMRSDDMKMDEEEDEEDGLRGDMKDFLSGSFRLPEEMMGRKQKAMYMSPKRGMKVDAIVAKMEAEPRKKRGRKKKAM